VSGSGPRYSGRAELTRAAARARLFLSSYATLFGILAIRFDGLTLRIVCAALFVVGVLDTLHITRRSRKGVVPYEITVTSSEDTGGEVSGYLASYLLPFVTIPMPGWRDLLGYALFLIVGLIIYVRSNMVRVNPTLYLLGYRVLAIRYGSGKDQYLITRVRPRDGSTLTVVDVAGVLLDTGGAHAHS
jgi:hypothetical protein